MRFDEMTQDIRIAFSQAITAWYLGVILPSPLPRAGWLGDDGKAHDPAAERHARRISRQLDRMLMTRTAALGRALAKDGPASHAPEGECAVFHVDTVHLGLLKRLEHSALIEQHRQSISEHIAERLAAEIQAGDVSVDAGNAPIVLCARGALESRVRAVLGGLDGVRVDQPRSLPRQPQGPREGLGEAHRYLRRITGLVAEACGHWSCHPDYDPMEEFARDYLARPYRFDRSLLAVFADAEREQLMGGSGAAAQRIAEAGFAVADRQVTLPPELARLILDDEEWAHICDFSGREGLSLLSAALIRRMPGGAISVGYSGDLGEAPLLLAAERIVPFSGAAPEPTWGFDDDQSEQAQKGRLAELNAALGASHRQLDTAIFEALLARGRIEEIAPQMIDLPPEELKPMAGRAGPLGNDAACRAGAERGVPGPG
ncbi:hypothetical protein J2T57_001477 [Natronocella acetinitrilica]|uniref:Uncharacterized protein n=1 Tax=Natronocella acetinitrilica TaxID=414046 RepID=A0AAE3KAI8_9GAMM|nr:hypothetical protein [Natronocella acetinitrilica]MCP1674375.1 hypothetical protein [Natronocella acetinitrilica]